MTISVIIPAYNQGAYLRQAVQSVLDQTRQDFEIVIVDDGSTDNTAEVARAFEDGRVQYVYQSNCGLSAARNTGIRHSTGELLTFLDSDDLNLPEKHELLAAEMEKLPEIGFMAGQSLLIDEHGRHLGKAFKTPIPEDTARLLLWNPLHVGSVMVRRQWIERVGDFDESLRAYEDWDLYLRLARAGCQMKWVARPVSLYRFHTQQMNRDRQRMSEANFAVLQKTYASPSLPARWMELKDLAYSNAYLRNAMQAFLAEDDVAGSLALAEAVRLDADLAANWGSKLAARLASLSDTPKVKDRLAFLERVYNHLPESLSELGKRKNAGLGALAAQLGFEAYHNHDWQAARRWLLGAIAYQPKWLANRGVLSILARTSLPGVLHPRGSEDHEHPPIRG